MSKLLFILCKKYNFAVPNENKGLIYTENKGLIYTMIGIFNDNFPPVLDGVALTAKNYADWLSKKQEEVCVVTPYAPGMVKNTPYPIYTYTSVPIPMRPPYRSGLPQ